MLQRHWKIICKAVLSPYLKIFGDIFNLDGASSIGRWDSLRDGELLEVRLISADGKLHPRMVRNPRYSVSEGKGLKTTLALLAVDRST